MRPIPRQLSRVLAERFGYADWRGANRLPEDLLVWNFRPTGDELPGWQPYTVTEVRPPAAPRSIQSAWAPGEGGGLLLVDVFECDSRLHAHAFAIQLLGLFESPYIARLPESATGDVVFGDPDGHVRVFARGNLVVSVRPGEPQPAPVDTAAAQLDEELVRKPPEAAEPAAPSVRRVTVPSRAVRAGAELELDVDAEDPEGRHVWMKAFTPTGRLALREGKPVYRHEAAAAPEVTLCAVAGREAASRRSLEVLEP